MDVSDLYKQDSTAYSPDGSFIAIALLHRVVIRDARTLQITNVFSSTDAIAQVSWSPDSRLVAGFSYKKAFVQIWNLDDCDWKAKINISAPFGLTNVVWVPDSRHIMTYSELGVAASKLKTLVLNLFLTDADDGLVPGGKVLRAYCNASKVPRPGV